MGKPPSGVELSGFAPVDADDGVRYEFNGAYLRTVETDANGVPAYREPTNDVWLCFDREKQEWMVQTTEHKFSSWKLAYSKGDKAIKAWEASWSQLMNGEFQCAPDACARALSPDEVCTPTPTNGNPHNPTPLF